MSHRRFFYLFLALCLLVSLPLMTSAAPVPEKEHPPVADCSALADPEARAKLSVETLANLQTTCKAEADPDAAVSPMSPLTVSAGNSIYQVHVDDSYAVGVYTATTGPSHPAGSGLNVLYGGGSPGTSFNSIRSYTSNTDYVQVSGRTSVNPTVYLAPYAAITPIGTTGFRTTYTLPGPPTTPDTLTIYSDVEVVGTTFQDSAIKVTTTVINNGTAPVSIGVRYEWDYQIASDDGPTFQQIAPNGPVLFNEAGFSAPVFLEYKIQDNDVNPTPPTFFVFGTVVGPSALAPTRPDLLQYVAWPRSSSTAFDFTVDPLVGVATSGVDYNDSATLIYFGHDSQHAITIPAGGQTSVNSAIFASSPQAELIQCALEPATATNPIDTRHVVTGTVLVNGIPVPGVPMTITVTAGPNTGTGAQGPTDGNGQLVFGYTGHQPGTDTITGDGWYQGIYFNCTAQKTWVQVGFGVYGYIFLDTNSNGVRDLTEQTGIQVPVTLKQGATTVGSVWSFLPGGWYDFGLYDPGNYCVQAAIPPEYVVTSANPVCFTLDQNRGINIGVRLGKATIGDFVWYDDNANGVQDPGELGIGNVTVALWSGAGGAPGSILQTATTAADGKYLFDVIPGTYFVQVTDANGVLTGLTLTVGPQSKPNPAGPISVVDGAAYLDADFGYALVCVAGRGGLSGHVWWDANGDGMLGGSEAGIAGVTVCAQPLSYLATRCTVTNGWGVYRMCLPKGTYLVAPDKGSPPLAGLTATTKEFLLPAVIKPGTHVEADFGYK